eukprot:PRCOL_00000715-RA
MAAVVACARPHATACRRPRPPARVAPRRRAAPRAATAAAAAAAAAPLLAEPVFGAATLAVMPLYTLMLAAPRWALTRSLMSGVLPFALMGAAYAALVVEMALNGSVLANMSWWGLKGLASNMSAPLSLSATWVHLLTLDLFVARAVYLDGLARGVPTRHSLVLCMMFGPLGYLLHYATVALARALRRRREVAPVVGGAEGAR